VRDIQWSRLCRRYGRPGDVSLSLDLQTFDRSFALAGFGSAFNELPYAIAWPLDGFHSNGRRRKHSGRKYLKYLRS